MESNGEADWELVSSSSEEEGAGSELQREAEALAHSFQKGEPSPPCSGGGSSPPASAASGELGPARGAAGEPAPGSPQHLQRLQLLAAPLPAPAWPGPAPSGEGHPAEPMHAGTAVGPAGSSPASPGASPVGHEASTSSSSAEDLHLRVVRSDDLHGLERAVAALEKSPPSPPRCRAVRREQELTLAQLRLSGTQAALEAESREAFRLRRLALVAGSVCAFLGLKALLGGPRPALRRCGASAAMQGTAGALRCPQAPGKAGQGLLCEAELDHLVAVKVEPLK